jgi:hypothetical protein
LAGNPFRHVSAVFHVVDVACEASSMAIVMARAVFGFFWQNSAVQPSTFFRVIGPDVLCGHVTVKPMLS